MRNKPVRNKRPKTRRRNPDAERWPASVEYPDGARHLYVERWPASVEYTVVSPRTGRQLAVMFVTDAAGASLQIVRSDDSVIRLLGSADAAGDVTWLRAFARSSVGKMKSTPVDLDEAIDAIGPFVDWFAGVHARRLPRLEMGNPYVVADYPSDTRANPRSPGIVAQEEMSGSFSLMLLQTPTQPDWRAARAWRTGAVTIDGKKWRLTAKRRDGEWYDMILWYVGTSAKPIAAGTAIERRPTDGVVAIGSSTVAQSYRRRGLYSLILKELRRLVGKPIESDVSMTAGAIGAWKRNDAREVVKTGKISARAFRINPREGHGDLVDADTNARIERELNGPNVTVYGRRRNPSIETSPPMPEAFATMVLATPAQREWRARRAWRTGRVSVAGRDHIVTIKRRKHPHFYDVLWYVGSAGSPLAAGTARDTGKRANPLQIKASAVAQSARRGGIYTATLGELRRLVGKPIDSDAYMTAGAVGAWKRNYASVVESDAAEGWHAYRINPRHRRGRRNPTEEAEFQTEDMEGVRFAMQAGARISISQYMAINAAVEAGAWIHLLMDRHGGSLSLYDGDHKTMSAATIKQLAAVGLKRHVTMSVRYMDLDFEVAPRRNPAPAYRSSVTAKEIWVSMGMVDAVTVEPQTIAVDTVIGREIVSLLGKHDGSRVTWTTIWVTNKKYNLANAAQRTAAASYVAGALANARARFAEMPPETMRAIGMANYLQIQSLLHQE